MDPATTPTPTPVPTSITPPAKMSGRKKLGLILIIAPTALWIITGLLWAITNWVFTQIGGADTLTTVMNLVIFLLAMVSFLSWLPGLITGIILLASKPATPKI